MTDVKSGMEDIGFLGGALAAAGRFAVALRCSSGHLYDDGGKVMQSIGFMRDLTAQHNAQKRIKELRLHRCPHGIAQPIVAVTARGNRDCGCAGAVWWLRRVVFGS